MFYLAGVLHARCSGPKNLFISFGTRLPQAFEAERQTINPASRNGSQLFEAVSEVGFRDGY